MNPGTGEMLAMVSAPSYNPNDFVLGMADVKWKALNEDKKRPLYNRFESRFVPGSVFKPITAAIGLESSKLDSGAAKSISGLKWQKDTSWGGYFVTRVHAGSEPVNLEKAFVFSDNIYFAQSRAWHARGQNTCQAP
jgi:penicillin-binding protein